jgi:hypothetical protein
VPADSVEPVSMPKLHILKADGVTYCGLKNRTEGLQPRYTQHATCKRCIAALRKS